MATGQNATAQKLDEIARLTSDLTRELRDEVLTNAKLCVEFRKDIQFLRETISEIKLVTTGTNSSSITNRLICIENKLNLIEDNMKDVTSDITEINKDHKKAKEKTSDRIWKLIISNASTIVTWIIIAAYFIIKLLVDATPPIPPIAP